MSRMQPLVMLISLGRPQGMGEGKRVASLEMIFERAGAEVVQAQLLRDFRARPRDVLDIDVVSFARGAAVPESLAWSRRRLLRHLESVRPDVVLCVTGRAYHPAISRGPWVTVLDLVDCLSTSYRDRSMIAGPGPSRVMYRALAWSTRRFERQPVASSVTRIAAGWSDAEHLGAHWIPITIEIPTPLVPDGGQPGHDLVFFGNLSYPPNLEAVEALARMWPRLMAVHPSTSLLLAGAHPTKRVIELTRRWDWTLIADFADLRDVLSKARLGVVPLLHASGIQIKILETAAFGLAQVVSPAAQAGLAPGFPTALAADERAFVAHIVDLLEDDAGRSGLGAAARAHVASEYTAERWAGWAAGLLSASEERASR